MLFVVLGGPRGPRWFILKVEGFVFPPLSSRAVAARAAENTKMTDVQLLKGLKIYPSILQPPLDCTEPFGLVAWVRLASAGL